jgi:hypothetical protein
MYDAFDAAAEKTRAFAFRLGSYVAVVAIPGERGIEVRRTMEEAHHYSVYADADTLLLLVTEVIALSQEV